MLPLATTMPGITTPACTDRGGTNTPTTLLWTSFPRTIPNSIRSSECGSSHAVVACTIATSKISKTSSVRLNLSSQPGPLATMSSGDYAQLLKTLCLVRHHGRCACAHCNSDGSDRMQRGFEPNAGGTVVVTPFAATHNVAIHELLFAGVSARSENGSRRISQTPGRCVVGGGPKAFW